MKTIYTEFSGYFKRASIYFVVFAWLACVLALFALPSYQAWQQSSAAEEQLIESMRLLVSEKSAHLNAQIVSLGAAALNLSVESSELFSRDNIEVSKNLYKENGILKSESNKPFGLYANADISAEQKRKAQKLYMLSSLLESMFKGADVDKAFIYIDDPVFLVYPLIDSVGDIDTSYNLINDPLYELFIKNPRKQWRLLIDDRYRIAAPVFSASRLIGIAGFEINGKVFETIASERTFGGSFIILDRQNNAIVYGQAPTELNSNELFNEASDHKLFFIAQSALADLPLSIVMVVPKSTLGDQIRDEYIKLIYIAIALTLASAAAMLCIYLVISSKIKLFSKKIVKGLDNAVRFSYHLGSKKAERLDATGIMELDDLNNHIHLAHSKITQQLMIEDRFNLGNRRKLLDDIEAKDNFGIICVAVNHHAFFAPDLYYAASDYVLERTAELLKSILVESYGLYLIGNSRFAILMNTCDRAEIGIYAMKVAETIERGHYIFNKTKLEVTARLGISAEKTANGAKLIALAEADLIKPENS
jgi:GGDEF domain-containing protein